MSTRLDRMIQRARAPLSALQPVMPSILAPEPPLREDVREGVSPPAAWPRPQPQVASKPMPPLRLEQRGAPTSPQRSAFSQELSEETLPVAHAAPSTGLGLPFELLVRDKFAADGPQPIPRMPSPLAGERPRQPAVHEGKPAEIARDVSTRMASAKPASLPHSPTAEPAESLIEVNVSIGSIDFRPARQAEPVKHLESHPRVTLDSYLRRGKQDTR